MAVHKFTVAGVTGQQGFDLYAEPANLNYFLKTPLTPVAASGPVDKQVQVKAHQRRQYPGDTTLSNIPMTMREFTVEPSKRSGTGLPGRTITLVSEPGLPAEERRSFTLKGDWNEFCAWLRSQARYYLRAYNSTGAWVEIPAATV
jgi:hypothetical protein